MKKSFIAMPAAVFCICAAGTALTLAYFTDTARVENRFSFVGENGINAVLTEPSWDPVNGLLLLPDQMIPKDPQVTNTSNIDMDILAALKVEFLYGSDCEKEEKAGTLLSEEDMEHFCEVYQINWNADDPSRGEWIRFDEESEKNPMQHFYYSEVLERNYPQTGDTSEPLFTEILIPPEINNEQFSYIQKFGNVDIRISGRIVQQMDGEEEFGISTPEAAYDVGLFDFET